MRVREVKKRESKGVIERGRTCVRECSKKKGKV